MILIVDDHHDTCEALAILLREVGLDGACADTGAQALTILRSTRPEAVVIDNHMPGMSGIELLRTIRADPALRDVPVLIYSAYPDPQEMSEAARLGAAAWLTKGRGRLGGRAQRDR